MSDDDYTRSAPRYMTKGPLSKLASFADGFTEFIDDRAQNWGRVILFLFMVMFTGGMWFIASHSWPNFARFFGLTGADKWVFALFGCIVVSSIPFFTYRAHRTDSPTERTGYKAAATFAGVVSAIAALGLLGTTAANANIERSGILDQIGDFEARIERIEERYPIPPQSRNAAQAKVDAAEALLMAKRGEKVGWNIETCAADFEGPGAGQRRQICNEEAQLNALKLSAIATLETSKQYEADMGLVENYQQQITALRAKMPTEASLQDTADALIEVDGQAKLIVSIIMIVLVISILEVIYAFLAWHCARSFK